MNKKALIVGFLLGCTACTSIGALSNMGFNSVLGELAQRIFRDMNNQDMVGSYSPEAFWYFQGRIDAQFQTMIMLNDFDAQKIP